MGSRIPTIALLWCVAFPACGARSDLSRSIDGAADGAAPGSDASAPCGTPPWIVFDVFGSAAGGGMYAMHADGSSMHRLALGETRAFMPSISPDGASLLYLTGSAGDDESVVLRDLPSGRTRTIAHVIVRPPSAGLGKAAVSPNNALIAYGASPNLNLVGFDGSNDHVLVTGPYEAGCCPWSYGHPAFSADSSTVYFSTVGRLERIGADGSGRTLLEQDGFLSNPTIPGFIFPNVSFSPDGAEMVVQVGCDVGELRVYPVASLPGDPCSVGRKLVETHLTGATNEATNASWGPQGLIVYEDGDDLFLIPANGGEAMNVTRGILPNGAVAADPIWVPGCAALP